LGIVREESDEHPEKQKFPIDLTEVGIARNDNE
jgi:hypothetical protein